MSKQMPKRPRQHQLEAESRAAIRTAIPTVWVYRDLEQDYGVDAEVEIFDSNGIATGRKFLLQLKATDNADLKEALSLWFPKSKYNYYHSLNLPVLIVRYHAPSKKIYIKWFHSFDPYYSPRKNTKGISFRLTKSDIWDSSSPNELIEAVEAFRLVKSPSLNRPLRFSVIIEEKEIHGISSHILLLGIEQLSNVVYRAVS